MGYLFHRMLCILKVIFCSHNVVFFELYHYDYDYDLLLFVFFRVPRETFVALHTTPVNAIALFIAWHIGRKKKTYPMPAQPSAL